MIDTLLNIPRAEILSFIGLALITFAFLPQAIQTLKTQETQSLSLKMYIMYPIGCLAMFILAIEIDNKSMMFWEVISFILSSAITSVKIKNIVRHGETY